MKKVMWAFDALVLIGIVICVVYFLFFKEKKETQNGVLVQGVEVQWTQNA